MGTVLVSRASCVLFHLFGLLLTFSMEIEAPRAANTSPTVPCDNEATEPSMEAATFEDAKPGASEIIKTEKLDDITTETGSEKMDVGNSAESLLKKETMDTVITTAEAYESDTSK